MKIAIMTRFHQDTYGTVLQAAALRLVLGKMGHEAYIIQYIPEGSVVTLPSDTVQEQLAWAVKQSRMDDRDPVLSGPDLSDAFSCFRDRFLRMTSFCATLSDLEALNESYDAFICGSDQIWYPEYFDSHYYLDFVEDPERMVAYAPCILEADQIDPCIKHQMKKLISRFIHLSVREQDGRRLLDAQFGEKTEEVADPLLLIEDGQWDTLLAGQSETDSTKEEPYLLAFFQGNHRTYWGAAQKLADRLKLNLRIIPWHVSDLTRDGAVRECVDPLRFVSLIRGASYICTDSFHATALSIRFRKEICCFDRYTERGQLWQNARIIHILDAVGLSERRYDSEAPLERYLKEIDYVPVNYKLDALLLKSRQYLETSLKEVEQFNSGRAVKTKHVLEGYSLCCACGACLAVCPKKAVRIEYDEQYAGCRAFVDERKCIRCGECAAVCPFRNEVNGMSLTLGSFFSYLDDEALDAIHIDVHKIGMTEENDRKQITEREVQSANASGVKISEDAVTGTEAEETGAKDRLKTEENKPENAEKEETGTEDTKTEDIKTADPGTEDIKAADPETEDIETKNTEEADIEVKGTETKDTEAKNAETADTAADDYRTEDAETDQFRTEKVTREDAETAADGQKYESSAGGLAYRLAVLLHAGGITVAGCVYDEETKRAHHVVVRPSEPASKLEAFRGDKYHQSNFSEIWEDLPDNEEPVAIFGTPCQIAGAYRVLKQRSRIYYIEISCQGLPSGLLHQKYERTSKKKRWLIFRQLPPIEEILRFAKLGGCYLETCYECRWRDVSPADLRIGDLREDFPGRRGKDGSSTVISLTDHGKELLRMLMLSGYWEGLHREELSSYLMVHSFANPVKPVFYDELMEKLRDDKVSMKRILHEYAKPFEKRKMLNRGLKRIFRRT